MFFVKKRVLFFCLLFMSVYACGQTITGRVLVAGSNTPVNGATVYYGGSMAAAITNVNGQFELAAKQEQIPVKVSCIGYFSAVANYIPGHPLIVYLKQKTEQLHAVVIHPDDLGRKKEEAMFIREFLGTSSYALSCKITNLDDVSLSYNKKTMALIASADKPLIIINRKLGYTIKYFLDRFENSPGKTLIQGDYIFTEAPVIAKGENVGSNREAVYQGSRMQLIRAIWYRRINSSRFTLTNPAGDRVIEDSILAYDQLNQKYLQLKGTTLVNYGLQTSALESKKKDVFINKDGFYNSDLEWSGALGQQRIGDLLPFEYQSQKEKKLLEGGENSPAATLNLPAQLDAGRPVLYEKTFLHTDRDIYLQGDTLWFKAYVVDAIAGKLSGSSNNLYTELIAPDSKIISTEVIRLDNGLGHGDIELADTIPPGNYRLRAYTSWMRNFDQDFLFEKHITLLGSGKNARPAKNKPANSKKEKELQKANLITSTKDLSPVVRFFPEGGPMVEGISSVVGIKAETWDGQGISAKGSIITASGDTITNFNCDSLGMGLLMLQPEKGGMGYYASVQINGKTFKYNLPVALKTGPAMGIRRDSKGMHAVITQLINPDSARKENQTYVLLVKHGGKIFAGQRVLVNERQTMVAIPDSLLPEGISGITLYDAQNRPVCERLVYIHHRQAVNTGLITDKNAYQPNEKVNLKIYGNAGDMLSIAAVDAGTLSRQDDIIATFMLGSELKGHIQNAAQYFDTTNVNRFRELDKLLLTQGWRDFLWRHIADSIPHITFPTENGITVSGWVKDGNGEYLPGMKMSLYVSGPIGSKVRPVRSDTAGHFSFSGLNIYGSPEIRVASLNAKGERKGEMDLDQFEPLPIKNELTDVLHNNINDTSVSNIGHRLNNARVSLKGVNRLKEVVIKGRKGGIVMIDGGSLFPAGPDKAFEITPADFKYETLEKFLLVKTKGAMHSTTIDQSGVVYMGLDTCASCHGTMHMAEMQPIILVNGQVLPGTPEADRQRKEYFDMPIQKFQSVVLRKLLGGIHNVNFGDMNNPSSAPSDATDTAATMINRYLLFLTMNTDTLKYGPGLLTTEVQGYYEARTFYQPLNAADASKIPYRPTLYWSPDVNLDVNGHAEISFFNAWRGRMKIIVQGISAEGAPISKIISYDVK